MASGPESRLGINQLEARFGEAGQGLGKVGDPVGDVVKSGTSAREETTDGSVRPQGLQKLQGADERNADPLAFQGLNRGTGFSGQEFIGRTGLLQGGHGYGDVVQRIGKHVNIGARVSAIRTPFGA